LFLSLDIQLLEGRNARENGEEVGWSEGLWRRVHGKITCPQTPHPLLPRLYIRKVLNFSHIEEILNFT
jgi:hypothetical protein